jgi:hypothetical protein
MLSMMLVQIRKAHRRKPGRVTETRFQGQLGPPDLQRWVTAVGTVKAMGTVVATVAATAAATAVAVCESGSEAARA